MRTPKLVITLLFSVIISIIAACSSAKTAQGTTKTDLQTCQIQTSAQCGSCQTRIEGALVKQKGVKSATLDLKTKQIKIKYDAAITSIEALRTAIAAMGYDADKIAADNTAYEKLPACCKKGGHDK